MINDGVRELPGPYELLDLEHGNSITLSLTRGEMGEVAIHPKNITPRHCTLPIAVASTGPATTGRLQASAVAWQRPSTNSAIK